MIDTIAQIAPEVDRLVWGINGQVGPIDGKRLGEHARTLGLDSLEGIPHFLDFWLAGPLPLTTAEARLPYAAKGSVAERIRGFESRGLLEATEEGFSPTDTFRPLLIDVRAARSEIANRTLHGHEAAVAEADAIVAKVIAAASDDHLVGDAHRGLRDPEELMPRFFDHLVTLRYIRQHDHVAAWSSRELDAQQIRVLAALWAGETVPDVGTAVVESLEKRGFVDGADLTATGSSLRAEIEAETNRRNAMAWSVLSNDEITRLRDLLLGLPAELPAP